MHLDTGGDVSLVSIPVASANWALTSAGPAPEVSTFFVTVPVPPFLSSAFAAVFEASAFAGAALLDVSFVE